MTDFQNRVFEAVKCVPCGKVTTYGAIALRLGVMGGARAVGNALHQNPTPVVIPCHRVVNAEGRLARAFVFGGINVQSELLKSEGVEVLGDRVDLKKYGWFFE